VKAEVNKNDVLSKIEAKMNLIKQSEQEIKENKTKWDMLGQSLRDSQAIFPKVDAPKTTNVD